MPQQVLVEPGVGWLITRATFAAAPRDLVVKRLRFGNTRSGGSGLALGISSRPQGCCGPKSVPARAGLQDWSRTEQIMTRFWRVWAEFVIFGPESSPCCMNP